MGIIEEREAALKAAYSKEYHFPDVWKILNDKSGTTIYERSAAIVKTMRCAHLSAKYSFLMIGRILFMAECLYNRYVYLENGSSCDLMIWAEEEFKLKRSALYSAKAAYEEFCRNELESAQPVLKPEYEGYTHSQLMEILPISHELRSGLTPGMTVKEIRKYKQDHKEKKKEPEHVQLEIPAEEPQTIEITEEAPSENGAKLTTKILPNLKERQAWVRNYRAWGAWLRVPQLGMTYYRYDFGNGDSVIVTEVATKNSVYNTKGYFNTYHMLTKNGYRSQFNPGGNAESEITDYLQKNRPTVIVYPQKEGDVA